MSLLLKTFLGKCCIGLQRHFLCSCLGIRKHDQLADLLSSSPSFD